MNNWIDKINSAIRWSFYALFFLVPLVMWPDTYELFEFNKMWTVFGISIFIFFLWVTKMLIEGRLEIRKTPLDIPIALFLTSQVISTIFSIDPHTSIWGYYSRFNGGLLSTVAYIFLYYAFATNLITSDSEKNSVSYKVLFVSLLSGLAVTLWGLPGHFGYDPTCYAFRGTLDVSCWTDQFQPTSRIFSTLGQPNWMGTFLAGLIPISVGFGLYKFAENAKKFMFPAFFVVTTFLFFLALLYTRSQSSFLGFAVGIILFAIIAGQNILTEKRSSILSALRKQTGKYLVGTLVIFALTVFFVGTPIHSLDKFTTLSGISSIFAKKTAAPQKAPVTQNQGSFTANPDIRLGGSESSDIRLIVWKGAIELFRRHPLFGTGVETYAYAYYGVKPLAHNLTSEWDFLYNKAHNEYLNYLATTGAFGLGTYLLIILFFFYFAGKHILEKNRSRYFFIMAGILGGYVAIIISDFFGFSVVPINLLFFTMPIFFFDLEGHRDLKHTFIFPQTEPRGEGSFIRTTAIVILALVALYYEFHLLNFWSADRKYALGYNLDKAGEYTQAYTPLSDAVKMLPSEDLYKDELSINMATLAILLAQNNRKDEAAQFANQAKELSDHVVSAHPNNVIYLKTRIRVAYALAQLQPSYLDLAIKTVDDARKLAPTDAKLLYNLGVFYGQKGDNEKMLQTFYDAIKLKPNYEDAYIAIALYYTQQAKSNPQKAAEYNSRAKQILEMVLTKINPTNEGAKTLLKTIK